MCVPFTGMKKPMQRRFLHGLRIALASSGLDQDETATALRLYR
jgi:hypothetical protein